ncbi:MAG: sugar ABC transporter substrate-binding protein [Hyphomicrobiales bacterium]
MLKNLSKWTTAFTVSIFASLSVAQAADEKITVLTWNLPVYGEKINGWIADFHEQHPDVEVEWIDKKGSEWATFFQTQLAAGTPPDVVNIQGALWAEYAANEQLLDLGPYLKNDPDFSGRFVDGALDLWQTDDGKSYMVPWYFNRTLLYLNKSMLAEAGIEKTPATFDELMAAADKMKGEGKSGFLTANFDWLYWPLFKMNGVDILNEDMSKAAFNTPEALETLTALAEATKSGAINNISWTGRWVEPNTAFASGNVGMYMAPNSALFWAASKADWINDENVEVVDAPGDWWTPNHHGWGVSASTKYPDAAVDLIKIATSDKWQETMSSTFSILTLNKNVDPMLIEKFTTEDPLKAKILTAAGSKLDKITGYLKSPVEARVKDAFWTSVQPALLGQVDPQKALDAAEAKVNRVLTRR